MPRWHEQATCRGLAWTVFYGANDKAPMSAPEISRAKQVCGVCPVQRICLAAGLNEEWGVWGGFTRPERNRAQMILGTWVEDDEGLTIIPADEETVLLSFDTGLMEELVVLR